MQKIKLDNGCKYLQISEVATNGNNPSEMRYIYYCVSKDTVLDFGILNCHKCKHFAKETKND